MEKQTLNKTVSVERLRCEWMLNPVGIDVMIPRLSWEITSTKRGVKQTAYQVIAGLSEDDLQNCSNLVWDTGHIKSDHSISCEYSGSKLQSRMRYYWKVRIWDERGEASAWSDYAFWEMGLLEKTDWTANWIEPQQKPVTRETKRQFSELFEVNRESEKNYSRLHPCLMLRKEFFCRSTVKRARIYATALGIYSLELNGEKTGDHEFSPGVTAYHKYLQYQTYDVTNRIVAGRNAMGIILADGWYAGRIGLVGDSCQYGNMLALLLQLEIEYSDGSRETINSDGSFKSSTGPLIYSDIFIGERYDARQERIGWSKADYDDKEWTLANLVVYSYGNLVSQYGNPVRAMETIRPERIIITPKGETVIDFGQVIAGRVHMRVTGAAGTEVVLEHSEAVDEHGNFFMHLVGRNKDQKDIYVLKGIGEEIYEPRFTFHGFRYVKVTGYPGKIEIDKFLAIVLYSDLENTGGFECSDPRINQLQHNILWSQKGNMVSIPTDCPQRERAGFTGDAQIYIPTACFNMDVNVFFIRWLRNLILEQKEDGQVPTTIPYWKSYDEMFFPIQRSHTSAGWGDACIIVPWVLYNTYGDLRVLKENYSTMVRWVKYIEKKAAEGIPDNLEGELTPERIERQKYLWNTGFHFGDWLIPSMTAGYKNPFESANATKELVACCFYAYCTELMAKVAGVLGIDEDIIKYTQTNKKIRKAFCEEYLKEDGTLKSHFQGIYVLTLKMDMVPVEMRSKLTDRLAGLIEQNGFRLDTGIVSTPYLMDVLCENGRKDIAFKLLYQTDCPSWLYEVEKGATTMWEIWDAITPDGKVNITSFNHYAFGCIGDWLYRFVAGLDKDQPGYKHILIKPDPDEKMTYVKASYHSVYGEIVSGWELKHDRMKVSIKIPPNTTASVWLPNAIITEVTESGEKISKIPEIISQMQYGNKVMLEIGSGDYVFEYSIVLEYSRC